MRSVITSISTAIINKTIRQILHHSNISNSKYTHIYIPHKLKTSLKIKYGAVSEVWGWQQTENTQSFPLLATVHTHVLCSEISLEITLTSWVWYRHNEWRLACFGIWIKSKTNFQYAECQLILNLNTGSTLNLYACVWSVPVCTKTCFSASDVCVCVLLVHMCLSACVCVCTHISTSDDETHC